MGIMAAVPSHLGGLYDELRRIAAACLRSERAGHTLQPTALVHEAFLRLSPLYSARPSDSPPSSDVEAEPSDAHAIFLAMAAMVMRRVLVDHARRRSARKRGSASRNRVDFAADAAFAAATSPVNSASLIDLDTALVRLGEHDPRCEHILSMRYFADMTAPEIARYLSVSVSTVEKDTRYALAWLARQLSK